MPIAGLSDQRRLARDGKIKLGVKKKIEKNGKTVEYPTQTSYFVVPEAIQKIYGPEPTELDIMFPSENMELVFPQWYKCYGSVGLKCKGDGQRAIMMARGQMIEKDCTPLAPECRKAGCKPVATLKVLLPKVSGFGVWDFNTSSWNSIVNLNTCIDTIRLMTGGKISFIPLKLRYEPHDGVIYDEKKDTQFRKKVYVMSITISDTIEDFHNKYRLPSPDEIPQLEKARDANEKMAALLASKNQPQPIELDEEEMGEFEDSEVIEDDGPHEEQKYYCEDCTLEITNFETSKAIIPAVDIALNSKNKYGKYLCASCCLKYK